MHILQRLACDQVRDNVPRLEHGEEELADLAEPAHRIQIRLAQGAHAGPPVSTREADMAAARTPEY
jgi:hypothetical protein